MKAEYGAKQSALETWTGWEMGMNIQVGTIEPFKQSTVLQSMISKSVMQWNWSFWTGMAWDVHLERQEDEGSFDQNWKEGMDMEYEGAKGDALSQIP